MSRLFSAPAALLPALLLACVPCLGQGAGEARAGKIEGALKADVPRVLCVDERVTTGAQPAAAAFEKLAGLGFRAVLDMRTEAEGHDAARERALVEAAGMRYLSLPVSSEAPRPEQIAEFTRAVKDAGNHPLFVHCASGNRVGAFWLAYRVVEDGWAVERALEEAERVGLRSEKLKRFALDYVESRRPVN
ncbi:MAG TPA: protein tyrosine phosphatase family protein [Pyrinomonadaceae bacterium]|nr:protein tyrosine phosphatase family protein [Pyrinomonadaceae bacterium]